MCGVWVFSRLSLVFPAIAIDQSVSYNFSWIVTKNFQFLMCLVVIAFPIILAIPGYFLDMLPYGFIASTVLNSLTTVLMVAALSVTYKGICMELSESKS